MTLMKILAIAAITTTALAAPAVARDNIEMERSHHTMSRHHAHHLCHHYHHHRAHYPASYNTRHGYMGGPRTGFMPLDFAGGVATGAVRTAGAVATLPARALGWQGNAMYGNSADFGYDGAPTWQGVGYNGGRLSPTYIERNAMACLPGTVKRNQTALCRSASNHRMWSAATHRSPRTSNT